MGAEGQPRLPMGSSWMQGWCESFLSSQGRAWRLSTGMGALHCQDSPP